MKLIVAVHFEDAQATRATAAAVAFEAWDAAEATRTYLSRIAHVEPAVRGTLDLRELPCVMQLLREHKLEPELILIDGFVHLDADETPGLGQHIFHALGGSVPIVGVSKKRLPGLTAQFEVMREDEETQPLLVTCAGIDIGAAKARLRTMHGRKRVPTLMKLVARLAKNKD
ncbi:endonuclease V [Paucibacter sp. DJ2R-2]|uniref:endonuclease V n=1 Tax=Paucibacter sp. DJ2R-2 TaxID=2893558 RepID=UPI0021E400E6|nr:endonuclease V [Paucibacter sp. DJ2R-2]MCV2419092.1 endonuclease V [Paucibacter sp. DJ4R-1]MCV2437953.1 endonuclease V [Paucibacter sp. DJ2R-2]